MAEQIRSATRMVSMFKADPVLLAQLKSASDPLSVLEAAADSAEMSTDPIYFRDKTLYRVAVSVLGSLAVIAALGSLVLVGLGKETPEVLVALGSTAVGALVGLFAPAPTGK